MLNMYKLYIGVSELVRTFFILIHVVYQPITVHNLIAENFKSAGPPVYLYSVYTGFYFLRNDLT